MFKVGKDAPILCDFLAAERKSALDALVNWVQIPSISAAALS